MSRMLMLAAAVALAVPLAAQAQATYRCSGKDGKKYYGSAIPPQCAGQPIEQLNAQGLVVRRLDPQGDEKARADKAAADAKQRVEEAANREQQRRNRALLATYTSERDIEDARTRSLADNEKAVKDIEAKIDAIKKRRASFDKELEFYKDKKGTVKPPAKLSADMKNAEIDLKAQEDLLAAKKKDVESINARYDEDRRRFLELTQGSAKAK